VFLFDEIGHPPRNVSDREFWAVDVDASQEGAFLLHGPDGSARLTPIGIIEDLPDAPPAWSTYSPKAHLWLWYANSVGIDTPGLWVADSAGETTLLFDGPVTDAIWASDGLAIFFIAEADDLLYRADSPAFEPRLVSESVAFDDWSALLWAGR
jgi:hypothetical protein